MAKQYSVDLCERVVAPVEEDGLPRREAAVANGVGAPEEWVGAAYGRDFQETPTPRLSGARLAALRTHKDFLVCYGFLDTDSDLDEWADPAPLFALGLVQ